MIVVEKAHSFFIAAQASLVADDQEVAWADPLIRHDPHLRYIVGRYVEADKPNRNGHIFPLEDLKAKVATIADKPLNMLHDQRRIIGHYKGAELILPQSMSGAAAIDQRAFVETLAAAYAWYAAEEMKAVEKAHNAGQLAQSMECVPAQLQCGACDAVFAYKGRAHPDYCACLQQPGSPKRLLGGVFSGGGLILPPARPAWQNADITDVRAWMELQLAEAADVADDVYQQVSDEFPHLGAGEWERLMAQVMAAGAAEMEYAQAHVEELAAAEQELAAKYSMEERMKLAQMSPPRALADGSYPINDVADLKSAIVLCRSGHGNVKAAMALIKRMAKTLGAENQLPEEWSK